VLDVEEYQGHRYWMTRSGFYRDDIDSTHCIVESRSVPLSISTFMVFHEHYFIFNSGSLALVYDLNKPKEIHQELVCDTRIQSMYLDKEKFLWVALMNNEVLKYAIDADGQWKLQKRIIFPAAISSMLQDKEGNHWFTTLGDGVYMLPVGNIRSFDRRSGLSSNNILCLAEGIKGEVLAGSDYADLDIIAKDGLHAINFGKEYSYNRLIGVVGDSEKIYAGTDRGLFCYTRKTQKIEEVSAPGTVKRLTLIGDKMYVCTHSGLSVVNLKTGATDTINVNTRFTACTTDKHGRILVGLVDGLYYLGKKSLTRVPLKGTSNHFRVTQILTDKVGNIWVATHATGLYIIRDEKVLGHYRMVDGLLSDIVRNIYIDKKNRLWAATNLGLNCLVYDTTAKDHIRIKSYTQENGLKDNNVSDILLVDSTIWVSTANGISLLPYVKEVSNSTFPIYLTSCQLGGMDTTVRPSYELPYNMNSISFGFVGISYRSMGAITYYYKVDELDKEWKTTKLKELVFNALAPGTYHLHIRAVDALGRKSDGEVTASIIIREAWFRSWWFYVLSLILLVSFFLGIFLFAFKTYRDRREERIQTNKTISELELQAIRTQINPHFIFNCLNGIQHSMLSGDFTETNAYLSNFAQMVRKSFEYSKQNFLSFQEEIGFIRNYLFLENLRFGKKFHFQILVDGDIDESLQAVPAFVIQPFIENAINHGLRYRNDEVGYLEIRFSRMGKMVKVSILDNGIGIKKSTEIYKKQRPNHQSKGMELSLKRVDALNRIYQKHISISYFDRSELDPPMEGTLVEILFDYNS
jgi:anti-sigma regulatory factor (Ser/Thr protein kinase)